MVGAWEQCGGELEWCESYPNLMKLWKIVLTLPASTASCERGFSKLNHIKNDDRSRLCLKTLDFHLIGLGDPLLEMAHGRCLLPKTYGFGGFKSQAIFSCRGFLDKSHA
jgi:hypothetical protein